MLRPICVTAYRLINEWRMGVDSKKIKEIQRMQNELIEMQNKVLIKEYSKATEIITKEINNMYNSYIEHFYLYKTKSYIRHGQDKHGTQTGINLYKGINLKKYKRHCKIEDLNITVTEFNLSFSGKNMEDGYQHNSPDEVLQTVMSGIRGVPGYWTKKWSYQYIGEYYQSGRNKMIQEFYKFMSKTGKLSYEIAMPNINKKMIPFYKKQVKELKKILFN